jgi:glycogen synthase
MQGSVRNRPDFRHPGGSIPPVEDFVDILLVGAYPPPIGGNSVHVQRLSRALAGHGHAVQVLDYVSSSEVKQPPVGVELITLPNEFSARISRLTRLSRSTPRPTLVHFHVSALRRFRWAAPLLLWLFRRQPLVLTLHSGSFPHEMRTARMWRRYYRYLMRRFTHIIAVGVEQKNCLVEAGIPAERISVIPAFIPADSVSHGASRSEFAFPAGRTIVLTSGYLTPLYNYDVLIDSMQQLDADRFHFAFAFYHRRDPAYEPHILQRLAAFPNVTVFRDLRPDEFLGLMAACDVYVRTTLTDGDAVAIREALHFNKPVLATDCVSRPSECALFGTEDADRLAELLRADPAAYRAQAQGSQAASPLDRILAVYQRALGRDARRNVEVAEAEAREAG